MSDDPDFDPQRFIEDLKSENAEAVKARILAKVEKLFRTPEISPERKREIIILING